MKKLTTEEKLEIALWLLSEHEDIDTYYRLCEERRLDCERNGFHDVPAECEDRECAKCQYGYEYMLKIDCPYADCL